jgi:hypothetical protein
MLTFSAIKSHLWHWCESAASWVLRRWIAVLLGCSTIITGYFPTLAAHHSWHIPVGVYVTIMGVVTAMMAFQEHPNKWEKCLWILCITAFMVAEIRNLYIADQENTATFTRISTGLDATKTGLDSTKKDLDETGRKIKETTTGIQTLYNEATGGDSLFYFDISGINGPFGMDSGGIKRGMMLGTTAPHFEGRYPLGNVLVSTFGPFGYVHSDLDYGTMRPHQLGKSILAPYFYFYPDKEKQDFVFFINTSNGSYSQVIIVEKVADKWLWASRLTKYGRKQPIRTWSAPGFPEKELKTIWGKS